MHHLVRHHLHSSKKLERSNIYWAMSLKTLGISLVSIFVPIYLYKNGFSLSLILLYFLIRELAELVLVVPTSQMLAKFGPKPTLTLGSALILPNLLLLLSLPSHPTLLVATAIIEGASISLFFLPYHYLFSAAVTKTSGGRQLGIMDILTNLVSAFGPLLGGIIATQFSFTAALVAAIIIVTIGIVPLLKRGSTFEPFRFKMERPNVPFWPADLISNIGFGITEMAATVIWPLFIYLAVKSYQGIGLIVSLSLVITVALAYWTGRETDKGRDGLLLQAGAWWSALVHGIRIVGTTVTGATLLNLIGDVSHTLFRVPWSTEFYDHASRQDRASYIAYMELAVCVGRSLFWILLLLLAFSHSLKEVALLAFILGVIGSILVPLIPSTVGTGKTGH